MIVMYLFFTTYGMIGLKYKLNLITDSHLFSLENFKMLFFPSLSYAIGFLIWLLLLKFFSISYIYPLIIALTALSIVLFSYLYLNEIITFNKIIGIFLIILAIYFINRD